MKKLLIGIGILVALSLIAIAGYFAWKRYEQREAHSRISSAVSTGQLVIEGEGHEWKFIGTEPAALNLTFFVHNKSSSDISGTVIFTISCDRSQLEREWIVAFKEAVSADFLEEVLFQDQAKATPKAKAFVRYLKRDPKADSDFEPIENAKPGKYDLSFRKAITLKSGELQRVDYKTDFPNTESGYKLSVIVTGIEFN